VIALSVDTEKENNVPAVALPMFSGRSIHEQGTPGAFASIGTPTEILPTDRNFQGVEQM
jgi:hypothetical protein